MDNEAAPPRRSLMTWLLLLAAIALGVPAAAWLAQDRLIFFPQPLGSVAHLPSGTLPLEVVAADGVRLRGWVVPGALAPAPVLLYFGGNAEEVSWTLADRRWPRAWSLIGVNYRGYGTSEGAPGELALKADALAIYDAVERRPEFDRERIVVFGRSLGTAVATHVASERSVAAAVLASPFDNLAAVGGKHYPWLPVTLLLRHRFDAVADAARNRMPLLALVAAEDEIIPVERSRALFDAWSGPKTWREVPAATHNTLGAAPLFWESVDAFLAER